MYTGEKMPNSTNLRKLPIECNIGDVVQFRVISLVDNVSYQGRIVGICDYHTARAYTDIAAVHQEMLQANTNLIEPTLMRYLIIECNDSIRRAFGFDPQGESWFHNNELLIIEHSQMYYIKLYNTTSANASLALKLLKDNGYVCKLATK